MVDDLFGALDLLKRRSQACLMWRDGGRFLSARARALNGKFGHRQQSTRRGHCKSSAVDVRFRETAATLLFFAASARRALSEGKKTAQDDSSGVRET